MPEVKITAVANGPYKVEGDVKCLDPEGNAFPTSNGKAIWLCRCGHSDNKPFCDGTHSRIDFEAEDLAEE